MGVSVSAYRRLSLCHGSIKHRYIRTHVRLIPPPLPHTLPYSHAGGPGEDAFGAGQVAGAGAAQPALPVRSEGILLN